MQTKVIGQRADEVGTERSTRPFQRSARVSQNGKSPLPGGQARLAVRQNTPAGHRLQNNIEAYAGRCRFRKGPARLMVRAFSSGGSFQGTTEISAFGASEAMSIETWSGCAVTSSGSTSIGVWHDFAKSRDTLYTKSGRMR